MIDANKIDGSAEKVKKKSLHQHMQTDREMGEVKARVERREKLFLVPSTESTIGQAKSYNGYTLYLVPVGKSILSVTRRCDIDQVEYIKGEEARKRQDVGLGDKKRGVGGTRG